MDPWTSDVYRRIKLALITGWPLEYIDRLGFFDSEAIYQVHEAENYIEVRDANRGGQPIRKTIARR